MTVPVTLYDQLCAVILEALTGHAPDKVTPPACLREDLGADDFDKLEIIIMAEDYFGLEISDDDASHIRTVGDLLDLVQRKQLDSTGHYQRVDIFEEEPSYRCAGLIIISLCLLSWAVIGIAAYAAWRHFAG